MMSRSVGLVARLVGRVAAAGAAAGVVLAVASGCICIPTLEDALKLAPQSLQQRQMQTRRYPTADEQRVLYAAAALLQDVGFLLESTQPSVGLLCASKSRLALDFWTETLAQEIRVSIVTIPSGGETLVRVTFQRILVHTNRELHFELIDNPQIYQEFFEKLSASVFLEGQHL
jgi:hypothetical protein